MSDPLTWRLVAPWWRWPRQRQLEGKSPLATHPVLQKYDASDPVSIFVQDPQRSLVFTDDDRVQQLEDVVPAPLTPGGKRTRLSKQVLRPTDTRKLFLTTHKRFYLVVCELHCDAPGLPSVARDKVCETGFVVRRHLLRYPHAQEAAVRELRARATALRAQLAHIETRGPKRLLRKRAERTATGVRGALSGATAPAAATVKSRLEAELASRRQQLERELAQVRADLLAWRSSAGAVAVSEGWVAGTTQDVGSWQPVAETPPVVSETVYPLYPLVPDPRKPEHDAAGRTIYFGMIPTGGRDVEASGTARFDEAGLYSVRCFVRRHRPGCPRTGERNDCAGELVWSEPTEVYQLAAHFDPVGTAHQPVTIQLPDLPALAAMTDARLPVQMKAPAGSSLKFSVDSDGQPQNPQIGSMPQICYISIPLITIVATFVLNLFLPIVVLLFNLWFLLGLKFCIPPSISFSGGASADLDLKLNVALQAELQAAVSVGVDADAALTVPLGVSLNLALTGSAGASGGLTDSTLAGNTLALNTGTPGALMSQGYTQNLGGTVTTQPGYSNAVLLDLQQHVHGTGVDVSGTSEATVYEPRVPLSALGAA